MNEGFLEHARASAPANVIFRLGDAYRTGLPAHSFDLVHMRFVAGTAGDPGTLIAEAMRLVRPGGVVALQEPDLRSLNAYPPHPAFDRLRDALIGAFSGVGAAGLPIDHALQIRQT
jgi:ubiquinone/menaquinone biosynthesis C-methylase UbiE